MRCPTGCPTEERCLQSRASPRLSQQTPTGNKYQITFGPRHVIEIHLDNYYAVRINKMCYYTDSIVENAIGVLDNYLFSFYCC